MQALEEEEVEIQSVVAEAFPLAGALQCAEEELHKGEVGGRAVPCGLEAALVQGWAWERAREGRAETGRVSGEREKGREVREGRIWAEVPKGQPLGWDGTGDAVAGTNWGGGKCVPGCQGQYGKGQESREVAL